MRTEFEIQLRLDMEQATRDIRVPRGLALAAYRGRKRQRTLRVVTAAATATALAGALAIAAVTGTFEPAPSRPAVSAQSARLTAYVIKRIQSALAPGAIDTIVGAVRQTYPPGTTVVPVPGGLTTQLGGSTAGPRWEVGYSIVWAYQKTTKYTAYTADGRPVFAAQLTHPANSATETAVIYASNTWWTAPVHTRNPGPVGCLQGGGIYLRPGPGGGWPGFIRSQLACGAYTVAGRQFVGGIDAIKLTGSTGSSVTSITLWVDPATYLPVQVATGPVHWTFQWLRATPVNLAKLQLAVPAGFQQIQPPRPSS
jgi:hypothetical protein